MFVYIINTNVDYSNNVHVHMCVLVCVYVIYITKTQLLLTIIVARIHYQNALRSIQLRLFEH